jgi:hypothetical protein
LGTAKLVFFWEKAGLKTARKAGVDCLTNICIEGFSLPAEQLWSPDQHLFSTKPLKDISY